MNIYFQLPLDIVKIYGEDLGGIKSNIEEVRLPEKSKNIIRKLKDSILERFKILEEEINKEEIKSINTPYILMDFRHHPVKIKYRNYSKILEDKMNKSFTDDDLKYLVTYGGLA